MKIIVNAEPREVTGPDLATALEQLGMQAPAVATALNGIFVPREARSATKLTDGDRLEVLAPMQGG